MLEGINVYIQNSTKMRKRGINAYIKEDGIYVYKSIGISKYDVEKFLKENEKGIVKAYTKILKNKVYNKELIYENKIMYKGEIYFIKYIESKKEYLELIEDKKEVIIYLKETNLENIEYIKKIIKKFLKEQLKQVSYIKTLKYAEKMNVKFNEIRIKDNKTNYGSCSSNKNINYNLRLIQMPENVMEYIVCHEVSHLLYMNHSKAFWNNIIKYYGDYTKSKEWLKKNSKNFI